MVLSQDCDIAIRNNNSRNLEKFQIVEINKKKNAVTERYLKDFFKGLKEMAEDKAIKDLLRNNGIKNDVIDKVTNQQTDKKSYQMI